MARVRFVLPALMAGTMLFAAPLLAQVQSQPLPPPSGTPSAPPAPSATPPATTPAPSTKTEPARTPTPGTKPATKPAQTSAACPEEKVDVNAASTDNLKKLPQIGVQRANAIVKARPYAAPEDLVKKKVLKKAVYDKIKACITASGVAPGTTAPAAKGPAPAAKTPTAAAPVPLPAPAVAAPKPQQ